MVWEQGSVVIVMLTKLTENGVAMCHRYWPEEGSDLYHIYEVYNNSPCHHQVVPTLLKYSSKCAAAETTAALFDGYFNSQ